MSEKSILQCCLSTAWGGLEMVAFENAQGLERAGYPTVTACPPGSPLQEALNRAGLVTLPLTRRHKYFALEPVRRLRAELRAKPYTAVLVQQLNDLWQVVPALRGMPKVRLVGVAHTFVGIDKKDLLHRYLYRRMDRLIALTGIHKRNLMEHLPVPADRIEIVPNAIDLVKFNPSRRDPDLRRQWLRDPDALLIGVVSRLDEGKGLRESVATAARLRDLGLNFQLVIVGKETVGQPGMEKTLAEDIVRFGLQDRVHLAGHYDQIERVIASLDVMLMPSPAETFGRVLIEAMASGVPVVAAAGGGVPDIVQSEQTGLLVEPLSVEAMSEALRRYHDSKELRQKIAEGALSHARENFASEILLGKLLNILAPAIP